MAMESIFQKTNETYIDSFRLVLGFSVFVILSSLMLPLLSSYINGGAGLVRYSSLFFDMTLEQAVVFVFIGLLSTLFLSIFITAIVSIVKLKETADEVLFEKVVDLFPKYVARVFLLLLLMMVLTVVIGSIFDFLSLPTYLSQILFLVMFLPFMFAPQVVVLEHLRTLPAITDAINFITIAPKATMELLALGTISLFALTFIEVILSSIFLYEHKLISIILLSVLVLPYLIMYATQLYIRRYPLAKT